MEGKKYGKNRTLDGGMRGAPKRREEKKKRPGFVKETLKIRGNKGRGGAGEDGEACGRTLSRRGGHAPSIGGGAISPSVIGTATWRRCS